MKNLSAAGPRGRGQKLLVNIFTGAVGRFVLRQSHRICSLGYTAGNVLYAAKDRLNEYWLKGALQLDLPNPVSFGSDEWAGISFVVASSVLWFSKSGVLFTLPFRNFKYDVTGFKLSGLAGIAGCGFLSAAAFGAEQYLRAASVIPLVAMGGIMLFQGEISAYAKNLSKKTSNIFNHVGGAFGKYPVAINGATDLGSFALMALGTAFATDPAQAPILTVWTLAAIGLIANDKRVRALQRALLIKKRKAALTI